MDPVFVVLAFHSLNEIDSSSFGCPEDFVTYNFSTGIVKG